MMTNSTLTPEGYFRDIIFNCNCPGTARRIHVFNMMHAMRI